jgi:hypothetical protein
MRFKVIDLYYLLHTGFSDAVIQSGNEDDYIVISLVRTNNLGFLKEPRRINVMLSRCKKGMIICTNRRFIEGKAKTSLVGKLAQSLGEKTWVDARRVLFEGFQPFV